MSIFQPPPGFPPQLALIWPLIWAQILVLRALMRAKYGKGVEYRWTVTLCGRVYLTSIEWIPGQPRKPDWLKRAEGGSARLAAAVSGALLEPRTVPAAAFSLTLSPACVRRVFGVLSGVSQGLPLPET